MAIRGILSAAQSMLETEGAGVWKIVTLIGGQDGGHVAQILP
jgi:hypothetical protein